MRMKCDHEIHEKNNSINQYNNGYWLIHIIGGHIDIISLKIINRTSVIQPPYNQIVYTKPGKVEIVCSFIDHQTKKEIYSKVKIIKIVNTYRKGTLNGINNRDITVGIGSRNVFKCGMLTSDGRSYYSRRNSFWLAKIVDGSKNLISIKHDKNEAIIGPPLCSNFYQLKGRVKIQCILKYDAYEIGFAFNKSIEIIGKYCSEKTLTSSLLLTD
ncbi:unnamed protein product [Trichobilharzia regenti]|nr:unnamed protein product [Trichobilharzia regenti]